MTKALLIAGTHSGCGKTTVSLALMAALRSRGLAVQPFKVGPDFIDPGHHAAICGRPSRNLDTWMLSEETVRTTFDRATVDANIAVIEGVMGLFDGKGLDDFRGSSAAIARLLDVPVVLVVDAEGLAASVAAVVKGFATLDPQVRVAGVVCNRVAGARHYDYLAPAIRRHTDVVPLGWLPRRPDWSIPERHLGLMTTEDLGESAARWESLGRALAETVDVERLLELAASGSPLPNGGEGLGVRGHKRQQPLPPHPRPLPPPGERGERPLAKRVAVARDAAFCFYYPENLELLAEAGGEIISFSPLADTALPDGTALLYLGGGYPELHAARLAENAPMRESIRRFRAHGGTIYAECGGLMYACRELVDLSGQRHPMLDLLPARTVMQSRRAALGYVSLRTLHASPLGPAGTVARGHEFHYSRLEPLGPLTYAGELDDGRATRPDGLVAGSLWAGYAHLHFGSNPGVAAALVGRA